MACGCSSSRKAQPVKQVVKRNVNRVKRGNVTRNSGDVEFNKILRRVISH